MPCAICGATRGAGRLRTAPLGFVPSGWKRQVKAPDGGVDSLGYRLCLLDSMRTGDPAARPVRLAQPALRRPANRSACRHSLGGGTTRHLPHARASRPTRRLRSRAWLERLDAAYRDDRGEPAGATPPCRWTAANWSCTALDKLEEPASLVALKAAVAARLPRVDLPELLLEMHARTGFADGFTHASEGGARAGDVATSVCAVLLAEACNTGFEPLIRRDKPALRRSRLSWVRQNYIRAETLTRANAALVAAQNRIPLARRLGRRRRRLGRRAALRRAGPHHPLRARTRTTSARSAGSRSTTWSPTSSPV